MGKMIKALVWDVSGLLCSVGLSGDKTTAKFAGKQKKPDGLTIIPPWEARDRLKDVPVMELCGVNKGIAGFLAKRGAFTCGDVARLPVSVLGKRFGHPGRRIWQMCRGEDPVPVETKIDPPKSLGHGKVMPPDTTDRDIIYMYLIHIAEVNNRYGEFTLTRAALMHRSDMPNVIAPAWKPYGHRQTIVPTIEWKKISQAAE